MAGFGWTAYWTRQGVADLAEFGLGPLFAGVLVAALSPAGRHATVTLCGRSLAFVGEFSYSLYATHVQFLLLVLAVVAERGSPIAGPAPYKTILPTYLIAAEAVAAAWVFFQLIEKWSIRASARPRKE